MISVNISSIRFTAGALAVSLAFSACGEAPVRDPARDDNPEASASRSGRPTPPGVRFDPATVRRGDSVGVLVVDSIYANRTVVDSTYVGMARFRGQIELSGRIIPHFDSDLRDESVCFEADSASAARLPRWAHDERRPWFCFSNPNDAATSLGPMSTDSDAIVIEDFVIHRGLSDEVNCARFVERGGLEPPER
jgi:hypothetical protein